MRNDKQNPPTPMDGRKDNTYRLSTYHPMPRSNRKMGLCVVYPCHMITVAGTPYCDAHQTTPSPVDELDRILMPFKLISAHDNTLKPTNPEKAYAEMKAAIQAKITEAYERGRDEANNS